MINLQIQLIDVEKQFLVKFNDIKANGLTEVQFYHVNDPNKHLISKLIDFGILIQLNRHENNIIAVKLSKIGKLIKEQIK